MKLYKYSFFILLAYLLITNISNTYTQKIDKAIEHGKQIERSNRDIKVDNLAHAQMIDSRMKAMAYGKMPVHQYAANKFMDWLNK